MKTIILLPFLVLLSFSVKSETPDATIDKLIWTCSKDGDIQSLLLYKTSESYKHSSDYVIFIDDQQICNSLHVTCPYEGGIAKGNTYYPNYKGKYIYTSTKGRYNNGIIFYSENGGMKLNSLYTGSRAGVNWNKNWYFKYGQCLKHN